MTRLARYAGPVRAYRGAIGWLSDRGLLIGGRTVAGPTERPVYRLSCDGVGGAVYAPTWRKACGWLADWLEARAPDMAAAVRSSPPDPAGLSVVVEGERYTLTAV